MYEAVPALPLIARLCPNVTLEVKKTPPDGDQGAGPIRSRRFLVKRLEQSLPSDSPETIAGFKI
jgi:hypothetical protein